MARILYMVLKITFVQFLY